MSRNRAPKGTTLRIAAVAIFAGGEDGHVDLDIVPADGLLEGQIPWHLADDIAAVRLERAVTGEKDEAVKSATMMNWAVSVTPGDGGSLDISPARQHISANETARMSPGFVPALGVFLDIAVS